MKLLRLLLAILREIGDENAYARHLARLGRPHSAEEYRRFANHRNLLQFEHPATVLHIGHNDVDSAAGNVPVVVPNPEN